MRVNRLSPDDELAEEMERTLARDSLPIYMLAERAKELGYIEYEMRTKHGLFHKGFKCYLKRRGVDVLEAYLPWAPWLRLRFPGRDEKTIAAIGYAVFEPGFGPVRDDVLKRKRFLTNTFYIDGVERPEVVLYLPKARPF